MNDEKDWPDDRPWYEFDKQHSKEEAPTTQTIGVFDEEVKASYAAQVGGANIVRFYARNSSHALTRHYVDGYDYDDLTGDITIFSSRAVIVLKGKGMAVLWEALVQETIDAVTLGEIWEGVTVADIIIYRAGERPPPFNLSEPP